MDLTNLDHYRATPLAGRIAWQVNRGFTTEEALRDTLTGASVTADDVVTLLNEPGADIPAILRATPTRLLRAIADLTYAVSYPDTATRAALLRAIPEAL